MSMRGLRVSILARSRRCSPLDASIRRSRSRRLTTAASGDSAAVRSRVGRGERGRQRKFVPRAGAGHDQRDYRGGRSALHAARRRLRQDQERGGRVQAEPEANSSSVYNFLVRPRGRGGDARRSARDLQLVGHRPAASDDRRRLRVARNPGIESAARRAGRGEEDASPGVRQAERIAAAASSPAGAQASGPGTVRNQGKPPSSIDKTDAATQAPASSVGYSLGGNFKLPAPPPQ